VKISYTACNIFKKIIYGTNIKNEKLNKKGGTFQISFKGKKHTIPKKN
jgi:hypothetical protein